MQNARPAPPFFFFFCVQPLFLIAFLQYSQTAIRCLPLHHPGLYFFFFLIALSVILFLKD